MKIALVHELLTMRGGAEKVLRILAGMFPEAPIYTLLYNEALLGDWFPSDRVRPSQLQRRANRLPSASGRFNHHRYLGRFPAATEAWDFSDFDLVISSSSAFAHGIITNGNPKHLCYVHSPARYLWDRSADVMDRAGRGLLGPVKKSYLSRRFHALRTWDAEAADRPDVLIAASKTVQRRIELYWQRESTVIHPPIDDCWFDTDASDLTPELRTPKSYYVVASTLVPYKRIEIAIEACNERGAHLIIAGEGPDAKRLRSIAGNTVEFIGYKKEHELKALYANARATLFPGDEDFGLVPLESLACGTPVIACRSGGILETMIEGTTAELFDEATSSSLVEAMKRFEAKSWSADACRKQSHTFSRTRFETGLERAIHALMQRTPVTNGAAVPSRS